MSTEREENFRRIAESRTNKIIKAISLLGDLSNKSYYEYTEEQINAIFNAIQNELDVQRGKFNEKGNSRKKFRL